MNTDRMSYSQKQEIGLTASKPARLAHCAYIEASECERGHSLKRRLYEGAGLTRSFCLCKVRHMQSQLLAARRPNPIVVACGIGLVSVDF